MLFHIVLYPSLLFYVVRYVYNMCLNVVYPTLFSFLSSAPVSRLTGGCAGLAALAGVWISSDLHVAPELDTRP